jgi:hypothetical protein
MDALFGVERAKKLRARLRQSQIRLLDREGAILKEIADAFREKGGRFFLPFRLWMEDQRRISHHLLFVSKNFRGYPLMKEIMAPESSSAPQGVPSFEYNPRDYSMLPSFELYQPLDELEKRLLADLGGRTLTMNQIYERHSVNKPFTKKNYKQALQALYARGAIEAQPRTQARHLRRPHLGQFSCRRHITKKDSQPVGVKRGVKPLLARAIIPYFTCKSKDRAVQ